jgi:two-component system, LytTR family, sensor kinase
MEFDNDRIIKPRYRIEIIYWVLLALMNPVINAFTFFPGNIKIWILLLMVNLIVLPLYLAYSGWIVARFLFQHNARYFVLLSLAMFLAAHIALYLSYALVLTLNLSPGEKYYFIFNYDTVIRESIWIIINMSLAAGIYFIKKALDEKDLLAAMQKENNFFKLRYLRAQLNPHFLFNTLNSIYSLSLQKSDKAPEAVIKLADIMRYLIYECNEDRIPLDKEINFINNYIEIEKIRFKADIRFTVEGETDGIMIEPFLFISFIENGFKHALDNTAITPFIYITLKVKPGEIILNVLNNTNIDLETQAKRINGKGITGSKSLLELLYPSAYTLDIIQTDKDERQESKVRLKNARERLETLYPDAHTLDVILKNNVFTVSLIIKPVAA